MEHSHIIPPPDFEYLSQVAQVTQNGQFILGVFWCTQTKQIVIENASTGEFMTQKDMSIQDSLNDCMCIEEMGIHWFPNDLYTYVAGTVYSETNVNKILKEQWKAFAVANTAVQFDIRDIRKTVSI